MKISPKRRNDGVTHSSRLKILNILLLITLIGSIIESAEGYYYKEDQDDERSDFIQALISDRENDEYRSYLDNRNGFDARRSEGPSEDDDVIDLDFIQELLKEENQDPDSDHAHAEYPRQSNDNNMDLDEDELDSDFLDEIMAFFLSDTTTLKVREDMEPNWTKVAKFLKTYQKELHKWKREGGLAEWAKDTNITKHNTEVANKISLEMADWLEKKRHEAEKFSKEGLTYVQKRMLKFILETSSLNEKYLRKLVTRLKTTISNIYSKAKVCNKATRKCYHFEPGLINVFRTSHNYDELLWAWKGWRDAIGPKIRRDWIKASRLLNKGAREHGYRDKGDYIRHSYEDPTFEEEIDKLWERLKPLYQQVHAYVRYKLNKVYGERVSLNGPIPAHLLGGMWAMKWDNILDLVQPYPKAGAFAVTKGMKRMNMTVHRMFVLADEFYRSIGLPAMTPQFWNYSMFTRPKDNRSVVCYASAHNLEGDDVRVKMCAAVTAEYLYVVHHEMGHCQYYLAYNRHQPELFQAGANHGFHEAIGDTAALSVISPTHLEKLGILKGTSTTEEEKKQKDLNFLMQKALGKLAFFPFAMTMAKYIWDYDRGIIPVYELNEAWWRYRKRYQGLTPPVERTERDFDAGSKYHIANFVPYVRYFVSHVLQFQFFEALCDLAGYKGPLHRCDFANSTAAGDKFKKMLQMGSSKPWPYALKELTNTTKMSADSVVQYFSPLLKWLKAENKRLGNKIGWD